ncbi:hypothetical protein JMJ58_21515 (plasmid) [Haloterrigena salifodinae]|uniref:Uncharacterized protein n=1 Tax=Haloterrigena salifodinae TaxID=2675099 RepID=A0A8T8E6R6_9EURY|nr:hypothetical protein [Haloterrigena salifodinae]QRV17419.1 hypothetical protein JMJ58_21515 [Haloterrigena salifodinae]
MESSRREILRKITITTVGMSSLASSGSVSATDDQGNSWDFNELAGEERDEVLDIFSSDSDVQTLLQHARQNRWEYDLDEAKVIKTISPDIEKYSVTLEFQADHDTTDDNVFLCWE